VRASTICKSHTAGRGSAFARALGSTIRQRRERLGLSQQDVGGPLSRAFISLVENGRVSPSLPSLVLISARLDLPPWKLLKTVSEKMAKEFESWPPGR
jgi:transcriptional regulator with XRE-family HTH domain